MTNKIDFLVERFERIANDWSALGDPEDADAIAAMRDVAKYIGLFRDTLMSIAQNQNGIPAHQAQDVLQEAGLCYHHTSVFRVAHPPLMDDTWHCQDCGRIDSKALVPYQ